MALTKISGSVIKDSVSLSGNVSVGGTLTYEDVTNVDAVGVITAREGIFIPDNKVLHLGNVSGTGDLQIYHDTNHSYVKDVGTGDLVLQTQGGHVRIKYGSHTMALFQPSGFSQLYFNNNVKLATTNTGAVVTGVLTATSFSGDGSSLSNLPAGAPVGGASTNTVFFENDKLVEVGYQITSTKNAMSAGPVSVSAGIAVTIPSGCSWTIV